MCDKSGIHIPHCAQLTYNSVKLKCSTICLWR